MTVMPTMVRNPHHSWDAHHDEERAALKFDSEKPKVVNNQNN